MTPEDLAKHCRQVVEQAEREPGIHVNGAEVVLTLKRSPPKGNTVRLAPGGPLGKYVGYKSESAFFARFSAGEILNWLATKKAREANLTRITT